MDGIDIQCPSCGVEQTVHLPAGSTAACGACFSAFVVPTYDSPAPDTADELVDETASASLLPTVLVAGLLLFLVAAAGSIVWIVATGQTWEWTPGARNASDADAAGGDGELANWTDADRFSIRQSGVKVRVTRADIDYVRGKGADNRVIVSERPNFLIVSIRVTNQVDQVREYRSWYVNDFAGQVAALTYGSPPVKLPITTFTDTEQIRGHTAEATLGGGDEADDVIIFALPAGVSGQQLTRLRLTLPGAALGLAGDFRFEIPVGMIEDHSTKPLLEVDDGSSDGAPEAPSTSSTSG